MHPENYSSSWIAEYYRSAAIRSRIAEYCDGEPEHSQGFRAFGLAGYGGKRRLRLPEDAPMPLRVEDFQTLLDDGADVCRSLADRGGTLIQIDIDYVDPENAEDIHLQPADCFARIEPIYREVCSAFHSYGVPTIDLLTARGYHLTGRHEPGRPTDADRLDLADPMHPLGGRAPWATATT